MKKSTIWILVVVMALTFASLLTLQFSYIRIMGKMRSEQFDEAVQRSLSQVILTLEKDETARFLAEDMDEEEKNAFAVTKSSTRVNDRNNPSTLSDLDGISAFSSVLDYSDSATLSPNVPQVFISMSHGRNSLSKTTKNMQEALRQRYLAQKGLLEDVILRILYEANNRPLEQRIDFSKLEHYLGVELSNNGLYNIPFYFRVTDNENKEVYRSKDMYELPRIFYKQSLFPRFSAIC